MKEYITKDSGKRQEYVTGMKRDLQDGKPDFYLLLPKGIPYNEQFLTQCAALLTRGKEKYGLRNFELASTEEELERFKSSAMRHFMQWINNEDDEAHGPAVFFNIMAAEMLKYKMRNNQK